MAAVDKDVQSVLVDLLVAYNLQYKTGDPAR